MKHFKYFTPIVLFITLSANSFCQSLDNFNDVLKERKTGKVIRKRSGEDISERTFLGVVKNNQGKVKYYVVKEFLRVKAAVVYHGHSTILFFNNKKQLVSQSILSLPSELPFKLIKNSLYFKYSENGSKKIYVQDISTLPRMICVEPKSCYDVSNP